MSGPVPELVREIVAVLPNADPVGCIVAALHQYDTETRELEDRLVRRIAHLTGQPVDAVRVAEGLYPAPPAPTLVERPHA